MDKYKYPTGSVHQIKTIDESDTLELLKQPTFRI